MGKTFTPISDEAALEELIARSKDAPVILFKHSSTCPVSASAYREMSKLSEDVALLVVQRARDISREVEQRTGVRHESPQAIVLRNGQAVWTASHWDVTSENVEEALRANA